MTAPTIRIGTRRSQLALWQANWVADALRAQGQRVALVEIVTSGDQQQSGPVRAIGAQGVFTREIQSALLRDEIDVAVHSLKDLPTETVVGLTLAAIPVREESADALVANSTTTLADLPAGSRVGTGSQRRRAQLLHLRPDLQLLPIRGNVDTRLRKLDEGEFDAIVLATAGLRRLGLETRISERLEPPRMLPAVGQGALGIECREKDSHLQEVLRELDDPATRAATTAERSMLAKLHGGCSVPVGAWARHQADRLVIEGVVVSLDGVRLLRAAAEGDPADAAAVGAELAEILRELGAEEIIAAAREA